MTLLEAVNKVLVGLREASVANLTATYSIHLVQLINDAKQDLEDMGPWRALRSTISKNTVAGTSTIDLTTETNDRSYPLVQKNTPLIYIVTANEETMLELVSVEEIQYHQLMSPDHPDNKPCYVAFSKAAGGLTAHFWPTPDAVYAIRFVMVIPQAELTTSDGATSFTIPAEPIWREALVRAMEERGEELSGPVDRAVARAEQAKWNAIMMDFGAEPMTFEAA
jgi:hypothetical protein